MGTTTGLFTRQLEYRQFGDRIRIADRHVHQEAVELGLRQGERAFLLDRVLCRHHHEQFGQLPGAAADGDLLLGHRLQQRGLHLGRCTVDLVGQDDVVEQRAALELEAAGLRAEHVGAGEVGRQQVGGELHAMEVRLDARRQRLHRRGLGQARCALDQQVTVGQQGHQQAVDQVRLADDALLQVVAQLHERLLQTTRR